MLALRLPPEIEQRLDALAKKTGRSKSYYAREAILRQIEDIEDYYLARRRLGTWRAAGDARKPGARPQEAHEALMAAPAWRVEFDRAAVARPAQARRGRRTARAALFARAYRRERRSAPSRPCADRRPQRTLALPRWRLSHCRRHRGRPVRGAGGDRRPSARGLSVRSRRPLAVQATPSRHSGAERSEEPGIHIR